MKTLKPFLALAAILSILALTAPVEAQQIFSAGGTATSTNTVVTYTTANPKFVQIANYGGSRLYAALNAVATAAFGTTIPIETCEVATIYTGGSVNTTLGLITAASTTTTYQVTAEYQDTTTSNQRLLGMPFDRQYIKTVMTGCNSSTLLTANGAQLVPYADSELITLATGAATTDSTGNLLHANSIIDAVVCRVTTTITTAVTWQISDPTTAGRFSATSAVMTAGATIVGLAHMFGVVTTTAAGPTQAADAKLRLTMNASPGAGVVRCTVFGRTFVAPTT